MCDLVELLNFQAKNSSCHDPQDSETKFQTSAGASRL